MIYLKRAGLAVLTFAILHTESPAALVAYEGFDFPQGATFGSASAAGVTSIGWRTNSSYRNWFGTPTTPTPPFGINAGLSYTGITTVPGGAFGDGYPGAYRDLPREYGPIETADVNKTYWMSFLIGNAAPGRYANLGLFNGAETGPGGEKMTFGAVHGAIPNNGPAGHFGIFANTPFVTYETGVEVSGGVHWCLVKLDFAALKADFWVDPAVDAPPATGTINWVSAPLNATTFQFNRLRIELVEIGGSGTPQMDEIRIGTTFNDVVRGVPEPTVGVSLLLGLGTVVARRRRK